MNVVDAELCFRVLVWHYRDKTGAICRYEKYMEPETDTVWHSTQQ